MQSNAKIINYCIKLSIKFRKFFVLKKTFNRQFKKLAIKCYIFLS